MVIGDSARWLQRRAMVAYGKKVIYFCPVASAPGDGNRQQYDHLSLEIDRAGYGLSSIVIFGRISYKFNRYFETSVLSTTAAC